jgi:hypothetical protein
MKSQGPQAPEAPLRRAGIHAGGTEDSETNRGTCGSGLVNRLGERDKPVEAPTARLVCRSVLTGWVEGGSLPRNSIAVLTSPNSANSQFRVTPPFVPRSDSVERPEFPRWKFFVVTAVLKRGTTCKSRVGTQTRRRCRVAAITSASAAHSASWLKWVHHAEPGNRVVGRALRMMVGRRCTPERG